MYKLGHLNILVYFMPYIFNFSGEDHNMLPLRRRILKTVVLCPGKPLVSEGKTKGQVFSQKNAVFQDLIDVRD